MKLRQFKALKLKCPILTLFFPQTSEQLLLVGQDSAKLIKPGHLHFHRRSLRDNINIRTDGETIPTFCMHFYKYEKDFEGLRPSKDQDQGSARPHDDTITVKCGTCKPLLKLT